MTHIFMTRCLGSEKLLLVFSFTETLETDTSCSLMFHLVVYIDYTMNFLRNFEFCKLNTFTRLCTFCRMYWHVFENFTRILKNSTLKNEFKDLERRLHVVDFKDSYYVLKMHFSMLSAGCLHP